MKAACMSFAAAVAAAFAVAAHADEAALRALAQGGHAMVIRHAKVGSHERALVLDPAGICANEANLSAEGRAQAQRFKALLDRAGVRFDLVLTSPFCRARDTATLVFGRAAVDENLTALELGTPEQAQARTRAVTETLARQAGKGNVALVTHRPNVMMLTLEIVEEGEAIVARIRADGELDVVGRLRP
jgi:phosphohistidine phosphatase SixA